ncbi:hypothetical protein JW911_01925 [Candidatus Peregrinibacteria bacterium]|nr:hypothetical protein [Candidatus Peregrinibacteria bacterium]
MKFNNSFASIILVSCLCSSTVFATEPLEIDAELFQFQPIEKQMLIEMAEPVETGSGEDIYTDDASIFTKLRGALNPDGSVSLKWDPYTEPDFLWYKIIHSQEDKELVYPRDGYIDYYDTSKAVSFDHDDAPLGKNYYRVCIITTDNRRGCSNQIEIIKEKPVKPEIIPEEIQPKPEIKNDRPVNMPGNDKVNIFDIFLKFIGNNSEIIIALIALILGITGYSLATKRKQRSISKYMTQIDNTYSEFKMKSKRCEAELYRLRDIVDEELKSGKLDEGAYQLLMNRIEGYMVEIQKQIVNEKFGGLPENLKSELFNMMENGEISEKEYEKFQTLINKSELSGNEQSTLLKTVKDFQKQGEKFKRKGDKNE